VLAIARQRSIADAGATYLLLVGLGATLSRAGFLALLAGLALLVFLAGLRTVLRHAAPPGLGALVAIAALTPSFPITAPTRPAIAILGLAAGFGLTVGLNRLRTKALAVILLVGIALTAAALATRSSLIPGRIGLSSPDRAGASGAALDLVATRPLAGIGPGQTWFSWTATDGQVRIGHYVHNEYLQVLVELGAIGLGLVLCLLVAIVLTLRRARTGVLWAGCVAGLAALAVHSGFDFLWHIPAVLLTAGMLTGLATPINEKETM
jgi:O-antigen ligase